MFKILYIIIFNKFWVSPSVPARKGGLGIRSCFITAFGTLYNITVGACIKVSPTE